VTRALITGVAGQDGWYLAELLCAEGAEVHGIARDGAAAVPGAVRLHVADVREAGALAAVVAAIAPDEIYHLAAPTFVPDSWRELALTMRAIAVPAAELLDAVREHVPAAHVVLAGSREMFGAAAQSPQREDTPCLPVTPYGVAKLAAHRLAGLARARHGLHASSAILFNHESPRRRPEFVTRKVARAAAEISRGSGRRLALGDLDAVRDWCAARDVVAGLRLMAAAPAPEDYVLASGVGRSVRELAEVAFAHVGLDARDHIVVDPALVREPEPSHAVGDPSRARDRLGWTARTGFDELVGELVDAELRDGDL